MSSPLESKESLRNDNDYQIETKQDLFRQLKFYGEGDSWYVEQLFSSTTSTEILKQLDEQIAYLPREQFRFKIFNTVNLLPRDKAFYGDIHSDGSCKDFYSTVYQDFSSCLN